MAGFTKPATLHELANTKEIAMNLKTLLKACFQRIGFDIVRYVPELNRPFPILPLLVQDHLETGKPFYFVQVGANDGILDDPLRDLILQHSLSGLLIEPLPDIFDKLKQNYKDQPLLSFENVAILSHEGNVPIYRVRNDAPVPYLWHGLASFTRDNLLSQGVPPEYIDVCQVEGVSLQSLLTKHGINTVTLLQIDTEGYDFEVIKSTFDAGIFPNIINYEYWWLTPSIRHKCKQMLDMHGYQFLDVGKDTIAIRKEK